MRPRNELEIVGLVEFVDNISAEQIPRSPRTQPPAVDLFWVGPQKVAHGPIVRYLLFPVQHSDLVQCRSVTGGGTRGWRVGRKLMTRGRTVGANVRQQKVIVLLVLVHRHVYYIPCNKYARTRQRYSLGSRGGQVRGGG